MGNTHVFFPQEALDRWLSSSEVDLVGDELLILREGRRYRLIEALRVLCEVSGASDPFGIVGRVKTLSFLTELGAEVLGDSMVLGDNAFSVVPGWLGAPLGRVPAAAAAEQPLPERSHSDEELLGQFLVRVL